MIIDKKLDSLQTLKDRIRKKFGIKPCAIINRLILSSGEIIDDISLIERNDKI
jgi:hypothetical protein